LQREFKNGVRLHDDFTCAKCAQCAQWCVPSGVCPVVCAQWCVPSALCSQFERRPSAKSRAPIMVIVCTLTVEFHVWGFTFTEILGLPAWIYSADHTAGVGRPTVGESPFRCRVGDCDVYGVLRPR
jgi:hypothetical protein